MHLQARRLYILYPQRFLWLHELLLLLQLVVPLNIQPVVVVRGLKRQQVAALTILLDAFSHSYLLSFFSSKALNDLAGPSAGPLARKTYSVPFQLVVLHRAEGYPPPLWYPLLLSSWYVYWLFFWALHQYQLLWHNFSGFWGGWACNL